MKMANEIEVGNINRDFFVDNWNQLRGELKRWWSKLTDADIKRIGGEKDKLIGFLQERYGYTRERAEEEIEWRLQEHGNKTSGSCAEMWAKAREFGGLY
jgi:uncharacterized protein YjbJ (UPF0337 family)